MKNILIYISISTQFKFILPTIEFIINKKIGNPIVLLDYQVHNLEKAKNHCQEHNIEFYEINNIKNYSDNNKNGNPVQITPPISVKTEIKNILLFPYRVIKLISLYKKRIKKFSAVFNNNNIKLLILTEQGLGHNMPYVLKASRINKIPTVVFPFAITADANLKIKYNSCIHSANVLSNKILSIFIPKKALVVYRNKKLLVALPAQVFALNFLKMLPQNPWSVYSGSADYVNAESEYMKDFLLRERVEPEKIISLGSIKFDDNSKKSENFILCGFPPLNFDQDANLPEFNSNKDGAGYWFEILSEYSNNQKVIISLHPRLPKKDFIELADKYTFEISDEPVEDLIKSCKFFITAVSSTIRLAIAHGKPVLNYDIYGYDYPNFAKNKGVVTVFLKVDFKDILNKLVNNQKFFNEIKQQQQKDAEYFGKLDNKNGQRLNDFLIKMLIEK